MKNLFTIIFVLCSFMLFGQNIKLVKDLTAGTAGSEIKILKTVDNKVIFSNYSGSANEIYISDGSESGTLQLFSLGTDEYIDEVIVNNSEITIVSSKEKLITLNKIDVSNNLNTKLCSINLPSYLDEILIFKGDYYALDGGALHKLNLTNCNAEFVANFFEAYGLAVFNDYMYTLGGFFNEFNLHKSDGTAAGTSVVKKLSTSLTSGTKYTSFNIVGNKLLFSFENSGTPDLAGLYATDGTPSGTLLLKAVNWSDNEDSVDDRLEIVSNDKLFFAARPKGVDVGYRELYVSDGTVAGTKRIDATIDNGIHPKYMTIFNGQVYFYGAAKYKMYKTSGSTPTDAYDYGDIISKYNDGARYGDYLTAFNGKLYSSGTSVPNGNEIWEGGLTDTDIKQYNFIPGNAGIEAEQFSAASNKYLYFVGNTSASGKELYLFDPNATNANNKLNIEQIAVLPNPAADYIELPKNLLGGIIEIIDLNGRSVIQQVLNNNLVQISTLYSGMYSVRISDNQKTYISKFIKL